MFANSRDDAYQALIFLSDKLFVNQGLSLQKSKTRILTAAEFRATSPIQDVREAEEDTAREGSIGDTLPPNALFRFSVVFDPYSPTAEEDYAHLKETLGRFDIMGLLSSELQKTRIHAALSRKIIQAVRYLDDDIRNEAVRSMLENCEVLYPIFSSVLILLDQVFDGLSEETQDQVVTKIRDLIIEDSIIMQIDNHVAFAIRVLSRKGDEETQGILEQLYERRTSPLIRRDIILTVAKWRGWYWLSDLRNRFRELSGPERRAFILASYVLRDEGSHWRRDIRGELSPFENLTRQWASQKSQDPGWVIQL